MPAELPQSKVVVVVIDVLPADPAKASTTPARHHVAGPILLDGSLALRTRCQQHEFGVVVIDPVLARACVPRLATLKAHCLSTLADRLALARAPRSSDNIVAINVRAPPEVFVFSHLDIFVDLQVQLGLLGGAELFDLFYRVHLRAALLHAP